MREVNFACRSVCSQRPSLATRQSARLWRIRSRRCVACVFFCSKSFRSVPRGSYVLSSLFPCWYHCFCNQSIAVSVFLAWCSTSSDLAIFFFFQLRDEEEKAEEAARKRREDDDHEDELRKLKAIQMEEEIMLLTPRTRSNAQDKARQVCLVCLFLFHVTSSLPLALFYWLSSFCAAILAASPSVLPSCRPVASSGVYFT